MRRSQLQPASSTDPVVLVAAAAMCRLPWRARGRPVDLWAAETGVGFDVAVRALAHLMSQGRCVERGGTTRPVTYAITRSPT